MMIRLLVDNRPGQKPELWRRPLRTLWRHAVYRTIRSLAPHRLDTPIEVTYDGTLRLGVRRRQAIERSIYLYGSFEYATTRLLDTHVRPDMCVFDVGAHIGYYALLAGRRVGSAGTVHAFEAAREPFERLRANLRRNSALRVHAHHVAVCDRDEPVSVFATLSTTNDGTSSLIAPRDRRTAREEVVPGVTLDRFVASHAIERVDLVKIDVEGAVLAVLDGAPRLLGRPDAPDLIFEGHDGAVTRRLRDAGFEVYAIHHRGPGGVALTPASAHGPLAHQRRWEAPNLFATKALAERLRPLVVADGRG